MSLSRLIDARPMGFRRNRSFPNFGQCLKITCQAYRVSYRGDEARSRIFYTEPYPMKWATRGDTRQKRKVAFLGDGSAKMPHSE